MKKMENLTEKFLNYSDAELKELAKVISEHFEYMKKELSPALDLVTPETVQKINVKFLREKRAEYLLDQQAIKNGYESAAHEHAEKLREEREAEADRVATEKAKEERKRLLEEQEAHEQALKERALKEARDDEDAKRVALLKAQLKAQNMASNDVDNNV